MNNLDASPLMLVIDDEPALIESVTDTLELVGNYRVINAPDGVAGLEMVMEHGPACIVVDVRMPNLDGTQFVRALRGDPATAHIPIVMLSALIQDDDVLRGLLSGADAYLRKPVRVQELLAAVAQALRLSQEQRTQALRKLAEEEHRVIS